MGRVAIEMMARLNAVEMVPRMYVVIYGLINIWTDPIQSSLHKYLEAYETGTTAGDIEYAITNLFQYVNSCLFGCGENLKKLSRKIQ